MFSYSFSILAARFRLLKNIIYVFATWRVLYVFVNQLIVKPANVLRGLDIHRVRTHHQSQAQNFHNNGKEKFRCTGTSA